MLALAAALTLAGSPPCSVAAAKAAVKSTHLTIPASASISSDAYRVSPKDVGGVICIRLPGGRTAMVVTVASGGTAGDIAWSVFVGNGSAYRVSLVRGGYKLGLVRKGTDIVETDPIYKKDDPNCCPSGGFAHTRWHWDGTKYAVVRTWHDSKYQE